MGSLGAPELIVILAVILIFFGAARLPKLAHSMGQAFREFKKGLSGGKEEEEPEETKKPGV